jgi:hypothetical protein
MQLTQAHQTAIATAVQTAVAQANQKVASLKARVQELETLQSSTNALLEFDKETTREGNKYRHE